MQLALRRPAIVTEGVPLSVESNEEDEECQNKSRMEELARSVAVEEVQIGEVRV